MKEKWVRRREDDGSPHELNLRVELVRISCRGRDEKPALAENRQEDIRGRREEANRQRVQTGFAKDHKLKDRWRR